MSVRHSTYQQLLKSIPKIKRCFDVDFLALPHRRVKLAKFLKHVSAGRPLLMLMAGCHGEEPASPLAFFKNYKRISECAEKHRVNLVIYPLVNPWGFDRNKRRNREGLGCNDNWVHQVKGERIAEEVKAISRDLKKYQPAIFASLHEEDGSREFYLFSFGDRKYEKPLFQAVAKHFSIRPDGKYEDGKLIVKNGAVYDQHDDSAEDFLSHRGCKFTCCTETPSCWPLPLRIKCNTDLILRLIELSGKL
jgi:hypothetical protein